MRHRSRTGGAENSRLERRAAFSSTAFSDLHFWASRVFQSRVFNPLVVPTIACGLRLTLGSCGVVTADRNSWPPSMRVTRHVTRTYALCCRTSCNTCWLTNRPTCWTSAPSTSTRSRPPTAKSRSCVSRRSAATSLVLALVLKATL